MHDGGRLCSPPPGHHRMRYAITMMMIIAGIIGTVHAGNQTHSVRFKTNGLLKMDEIVNMLQYSDQIVLGHSTTPGGLFASGWGRVDYSARFEWTAERARMSRRWDISLGPHGHARTASNVVAAFKSADQVILDLQIVGTADRFLRIQLSPLSKYRLSQATADPSAGSGNPVVETPVRQLGSPRSPNLIARTVELLRNADHEILDVEVLRIHDFQVTNALVRSRYRLKLTPDMLEQERILRMTQRNAPRHPWTWDHIEDWKLGVLRQMDVLRNDGHLVTGVESLEGFFQRAVIRYVPRHAAGSPVAAGKMTQ